MSEFWPLRPTETPKNWRLTSEPSGTRLRYPSCAHCRWPNASNMVEALWNSIVEEQDSVPDDPAVVAELRARKARFAANPSAGVLWEEAKKRVRSGRG